MTLDEDFTNVQFIEEQNKDKKLEALRDLLLGRSLSPSDFTNLERKHLLRAQRKFHLNKDGILCYKKFNKGEQLSLIAIPDHLITKVIRLVHQADGIGNHFGTNKCYVQLKNKFYFEDMHRKVTNYSQSCEFCQNNKRSYEKAGHLSERKLHPDLPLISSNKFS